MTAQVAARLRAVNEPSSVVTTQTIAVSSYVVPRTIRVDTRLRGYQLLGLAGSAARLTVKWHVEDTKNSCTLHAVLRALASFTRPGDDVRECWPSLKTIGRRANGVSERTVSRALARLYELNAVERRRQGGGRRRGSSRVLLEGRSNRYRVTEVGYQLLAAGIPRKVPATLLRGACGIHRQHDGVTPIQNLEWVNPTPPPPALDCAVSTTAQDLCATQSEGAPSSTVCPGPDGPSHGANAPDPAGGGVASPRAVHRWNTPEAAERALLASGFDERSAAHARSRGEAMAGRIARPRDFYRGAAQRFREKHALGSDASRLSRDKHAAGRRLAAAVDQLRPAEAMAKSAADAMLVRSARRQSVVISRPAPAPRQVDPPPGAPAVLHGPRCQCETCFAVRVPGDWLIDDGGQ